MLDKTCDQSCTLRIYNDVAQGQRRIVPGSVVRRCSLSVLAAFTHAFLRLFLLLPLFLLLTGWKAVACLLLCQVSPPCKSRGWCISLPLQPLLLFAVCSCTSHEPDCSAAAPWLMLPLVLVRSWGGMGVTYTLFSAALVVGLCGCRDTLFRVSWCDCCSPADIEAKAPGANGVT